MDRDLFQRLQHGFGFGGWIPRGVDTAAEIVPGLSGLEGDRFWMAQALLAAMEGIGRSNPNPTVGAVFVRDGRMIARGATLRYGDLHAERVALRDADPELIRGSTLYVTLEPCARPGKQPPCTEALLTAQPLRCVVGATDPHPKVAGDGIRQLRAAGVEVTVGVLGAECTMWHFPFLASLTLKRPVLIGKWAQTLDGHLADDTGRSQWISGPKSRAYTHWLRQKYDMLLVGMGTVLADAPSLTVRDAAQPHHRHPHKCVFDPFGRFAQLSDPHLEALKRGLEPQGAQLFLMVQQGFWQEPSWWSSWRSLAVVVMIEAQETWSEHVARLSEVYARTCGVPLQSIMVEGGPQLLTQLLREQLLDALHVFVRAGILGGTRNRIGRLDVRPGEDPLAVNPSRSLMDRDDYQLLATYQIEDDVVLECLHRRHAIGFVS